MKKLALIFLVVAGLAMFITLPSGALQKGEFREQTVKQENIKNLLDEMRAEIKANGYTFTVGPNLTMHFTPEQLCSFRPDFPLPAVHLGQAPGSRPELNETKSLPPSYTGYFTGVRNQGSCGGAWAFAAVGLLESLILKKDGLEVDLSEQYMISCNPWGWGCMGGYWPNDMLVSPGAALESCFPYVAADVPCNDTCPTPYQIQSWEFIDDEFSVPSVTDIKLAIYTYGAVQAGVYVDSWFQLYSGGVFNKCKNKAKWANYVVILCGWDDTRGAWLLKNCWGTDWGENGFMWIAYGCNRVGEGANYFIY